MKWMMDEDKEIWVPIEGYEGYEISTKGRVRSYWRCNGERKGGSPGGWSVVDYPVKIRPSHIQNGYYGIRLNNPNTKKRSSSKIHRLMAIAFLPNPNHLECVDHIDRNTFNNSLSNLRWCSKQQNTLNRNRRDDVGILDRGNGKKRFRVYYYIDKKRHCKGFETIEEARLFRKTMVEEHYDMEFYNER